MAQVFGHKYEFYIGNASKLVAIHNEKTEYDEAIPPLLKAPNLEVSPVTEGFIDYRTVPAESYLVTNPIQIEAQVVYDSPKVAVTKPQLSRFRLYNLDDDLVNNIKKDSVVLLKAGYEQDKTLPLAFTGTVQKVSSYLQGADIVTEILAKDCGNPINSARWVKSYAKGINTDFIFLDIIDEFAKHGVPLGRFEDSKRALQKTSEPLAFNGKLSEILSEICENLDYVWFTCKGRLFIQPKELDRPTEFLEIIPETIIGKIGALDNNEGRSVSDSSNSPKGIKFSTFLNAEFGIDSYIKIKEGLYKGEYKPTKVVFNLNWKNGPWVADIEAEEVKTFEL